MANKAISAYRYLCLYRAAVSKPVPEGEAAAEDLQKVDLGIPIWGTKSIGDRVGNYLNDNERLVSKIGAKEVARLLLGEAERKTVQEMWEDTLRYPGLPLLESEEVLYTAIREGVKNKVFGVLAIEKVYPGKDSCSVDGETVVLKREVAERLLASQSAEYPPPDSKASGKSKIGEGAVSQPPEPEIGPGPGRALPREYHLRVRVPWDKVSAVVGGLIGPLQQAGCKLTVILDVTARSEAGVRQDVLDLKVRETVKQIGAQVLDEEQKWKKDTDAFVWSVCQSGDDEYWVSKQLVSSRAVPEKPQAPGWKDLLTPGPVAVWNAPGPDYRQPDER